MESALSKSWNLEKLQNILSSIALDFHEFCSHNNIEYFAAAGTALGAIRHQGFIPWDEDMDFFMTGENYLRFRELFEKKGNHDKYYLQEYGRNECGMIHFAKIRMNGTSFVEEHRKSMDIHQGIFIDIFILNGCPNNKISIYWSLLWERYLYFKSYQLAGLKSERRFSFLWRTFFSIMPELFLTSYAVKQIWRFHKRKDKQEVYPYLYPKQKWDKCYYDKEIFSERELTKFEDFSLFVPKNIHEYLVRTYGDYKKIPNIDEISPHANQWNLVDKTGRNINRKFIDEYKLM